MQKKPKKLPKNLFLPEEYKQPAIVWDSCSIPPIVVEANHATGLDWYRLDDWSL